MYPKTMILAVLMVAASVKADVTVTSWTLDTVAREGDDPYVTASEVAPPVVLPFNVVSTATDGASESTSTYDFNVVGDCGSFDFAFDHVRAGDGYSIAFASGSVLRFSVSEDADLCYSFAGDYEMMGSGKIGMYVFLRDLNEGFDPFLLSNQQISNNTPNESFTLGETGGDDKETNMLIGSLAGNLTAGHDFVLGYTYQLHIPSDQTDSGASAVGSLTLNIAPCPPPSPPCPADLDGDGSVGAADLAMLLGSWGACSK
ncbi:MAG: hypothetical protein O7D91_12895 [Planctomycetota bacterium]|nr:hypothetical protein [Planctomycetota bacterium]